MSMPTQSHPATIPLPEGPDPAVHPARTFVRVWGDAMIPGFQQVPHALLKNQFRLGLSPLDVVIILNIAMHWWGRENLPYPTMERIAKRIGVSRRSIERRIAFLENAGIVKRMRFETNNKGKKIRRFDLAKLVALVEEQARNDPTFDFRKQRAALAVAGSTPATGLQPDIVQSQERPAASKPAGRARSVSPKET
jgi:predicted transcriptional regulator